MLTRRSVIELLGAHRPVGQITRRVGFIVSCAEGSPAELGTSRRLSSSCKNRQLSWGLP
jgi:hypothetical protein